MVRHKVSTGASAALRLSARRLIIVCLVFTAGFVGCGGPSRPNVPFGKVKGRVTWNGQPLANALVVFEPDNGRPSSGRTSESGDYELRYKEQPWGAIVGRHSVRITTARVQAESDPAGGGESSETILPEVLPDRFHSASTLSATVAEGQNTIDFDLTAK